MDLHHGNYGGGISQGRGFGASTDYIKSIPQGELHVHAPQGIVTGANLNGYALSNYEAAMLDLQKGSIRRNTGNF